VETFAAVPNDSPAAVTAAYRSAWSLYRLGLFPEARRTLVELLSSADWIPEADEARLLLAYAHLGTCPFEEAQAIFDALAERWQSVAKGSRASPAGGATLPQMLTERVLQTPAERRVAVIRASVLDAIARTRQLQAQLIPIGSGMPLAPVQRPGEGLLALLQGDQSQAEFLARRLAEIRAEAGRRSLSAESLRELETLDRVISGAESRARAAWARLNAPWPFPAPTAGEQETPRSYLEEEQRELDRLGRALGAQLERAEAMSAIARDVWIARAYAQARTWARLASIGQIDAVIGRKQAVEMEVQNLALGLYPLSLLRQLAMAGLVNETQEYWPFDGEDWPDEIQ
jgi:hypothetical protein